MQEDKEQGGTAFKQKQFSEAEAIVHWDRNQKKWKREKRDFIQEYMVKGRAEKAIPSKYGKAKKIKPQKHDRMIQSTIIPAWR